tara:strand:- start:1077 stop:1520 length:444 start_codon:yes stop_codon:yes gene_type:complete
MASQLKVDTLTGVTTAGSIVVTGEGNSTTTNLQQGLAKAWVNFNGTGTAAIGDSLNNTSLTDNATGQYTVTIANNMASTTHIVSCESGPDNANINLGAWMFGVYCASGSSNAPVVKTSTAVKLRTSDIGGSHRDIANGGVIHTGDLA